MEQKQTESEQKYQDIIQMPHPVSKVHPQMSLYERAAQFSPFAALTGHDAAIRETERLTEEWHELEEDQKEELDEKLSELLQKPDENQKLSIRYFVPDERKKGGAYKTIQGYMKKIDTSERVIILKDGTRIRADAILSIEDVRR